jgi:superfamily II DNA/RNA helicase
MSAFARAQAVIDFNNEKTNVILVSKAGGEGLNLKGVRNVIMLEPTWNKASFIQFISRAVRYQSHIHLPRKEQHVNVYSLYLSKPSWSNTGKYHKSVDEILRSIQLRKEGELEKVLRQIQDVSIEN